MDTIFGQPSFSLLNDSVSISLTKLGGHLAPVQFTLGKKKVQPFSIAPWWAEKNPLPPVLKPLRGDFFCMPFGDNQPQYLDEKHPAHGETATGQWILVDEMNSPARSLLHLGMKVSARPARVDKIIELRKGQPAIYQRHVITGAKGPICLGHHATLRFNSDGLVSTSAMKHGEVARSCENPAQGGYSCLKPGATFSSLSRVPRLDGTTADLSCYPAREGYEDIVIVCNRPNDKLAWSAVVFPSEGYAWISLKDPSVLASTLLWHSNGGRHYAPWNGRHRAVLGVEEITANFHYGLAESVKKNALNRRGIKTAISLKQTEPTIISYIMAAVEVPPTFAHVRVIEPVSTHELRVVDRQGKSVRLHLDWSFIHNA